MAETTIQRGELTGDVVLKIIAIKRPVVVLQQGGEDQVMLTAEGVVNLLAALAKLYPEEFRATCRVGVPR